VPPPPGQGSQPRRLPPLPQLLNAPPPADLVLSPKLFPLPDLLLFTHTFRDAEHGMAAERLPRRVASPTSLPLSSFISMVASPACRPVAQERRPHAQPTRVSPAGCRRHRWPQATGQCGHGHRFAWPRLIARPQRACMQPPWQRRPRHRRCRPRHRRCRPRPRATGARTAHRWPIRAQPPDRRGRGRAGWLADCSPATAGTAAPAGHGPPVSVGTAATLLHSLFNQDSLINLLFFPSQQEQEDMHRGSDFADSPSHTDSSHVTKLVSLCHADSSHVVNTHVCSSRL